MSATLRLLIGLAALTLVVPADDALPRYRFQPGQELAFRGSSRFKDGEGKDAGIRGSDSDWTVWVVRANPDGSFRLVTRQTTVSTWSHNDQKSDDQPPETHITYADVFPDGRVLPNRTIQYRGHPIALFPQLPRDQVEVKSGWQATRGDETTAFRMSAAASPFVFMSVVESPLNKVYLATRKATLTFDPDRGFVTKVESENTQDYGNKGRGTGTTELRAVRVHDAAAIQRFADDTDRYFAAVGAYEDKTDAAEKTTPAAAKELLAVALADLKAAATLGTEELRADVAGRLARHEQKAGYCLEYAERWARVMGKPAADFEAADLDGKRIRLSDLRGRVVVLDFWCRDIQWCIRAMPQLNQLADDFGRQGVAVFGINTDEKEADARFVAEAMALKYPNLRMPTPQAAAELAEKYCVPGFPAVVVIDRQGNVRHIHGGFSPTMREEVGKVIQELTANR